MRGIKIDRLLETVLRALAVAGGLADHPHQVIGRSSETLLSKMPLTFGNRFSKPPPVGQCGSLV